MICHQHVLASDGRPPDDDPASIGRESTMSRRMTVAAAVVLGSMAAAVGDTTVAVSGGRVSVPAALGDRDGGGRRAGTVWVVNRDLGEVAVFDARTGSLVAKQHTGAGAHEVAISDRAHRAIVTNEIANTISIVSTREPDELRRVRSWPRTTSRRGESRRWHVRGRPRRHESRRTRSMPTPAAPRPTHRATTRPRRPMAHTCVATRCTSLTRRAARSPPSTPTPGRSSSSSAGIAQPTEVLPDRHGAPALRVRPRR